MTEQITPWRISAPLKIIEGESLDGYVARVAADQHFLSMRDITTMNRNPYPQRSHASFCDRDELDVIADCLGVDRDILHHHSPHWVSGGRSLNMFGVPVMRRFIEFGARRFSPASLRISPHHRALWSFRTFPFCEESWEFLQDSCPSPLCGRRQAWLHTNGIDLCDYCAEPLTRKATTSVPQELREPLRMLVGLVHPNPDRRRQSWADLPPLLHDLDGGEVLALACELAIAVDPQVARPLAMDKAALPVDGCQMVGALAGAWSLLTDWPMGLENLISERINLNTNNRGDGNKGASYRLLLPTHGQRLPLKAKEQLSRFVDKCRSARDIGYDGTEAMKISGRGLKVLVAMRRAGEIPSIVGITGRRILVLYEKNAIHELAREKRRRVRLVSASQSLGVPTYSVRELVEAGLLEEAPRETGLSEEMHVFKDSVDRLVICLVNKLSHKDSGLNVALPERMIGMGGRPKPWAAVLQAIHEGTLIAGIREGSEPLARRIMVDEQSWDSISTSYQSIITDWGDIKIPKADVADILGIPRLNFHKYSEFLLGRGVYVKNTYMTYVIKLAKKFISQKEMAARLNVHPLVVFQLAKQHQVEIVIHVIYDRQSAESLMPGILSTFGCRQIGSG